MIGTTVYTMASHFSGIKNNVLWTYAYQNVSQNNYTSSCTSNRQDHNIRHTKHHKSSMGKISKNLSQSTPVKHLIQSVQNASDK